MIRLALQSGKGACHIKPFPVFKQCKICLNTYAVGGWSAADQSKDRQWYKFSSLNMRHSNSNYMNTRDINRHWKRIVNTMNDGLMLIDLQGIIIMVNQAFERLSGYGSDEVVGRPCTMLHCDSCELTRHESDHPHWCSLFSGNAQLQCRCHIMRKNGTYLHVLKNANLLTDENNQPMGAVETLTDISEIDRLGNAISQLNKCLNDAGGFQGIIGQSPSMKKVFEVIEKAAYSDAPVMISGESGVGKELAAQAIHRLGPRKNGPFIQFNCGALNASLLESELFGHIKGAFTGAYRHRQGRFEAAHGGDIFLDEIGDIPLSTQIKLLRVLESKQFERVGDHQPVQVDVRIITATHRNLAEMIEQKLFRDDLFFRINVIPIHLPGLRERKSDIPLLIDHFLRKRRQRAGQCIKGLTRPAMKALMRYGWPGNVRELKSALEYAFVIADSDMITPDHLPSYISGAHPFVNHDKTGHTHPGPEEKRTLIQALKTCRGNQSQAARQLGINRVTVWNRIKKYDIDIKKYKL